MEKSIIEDLSGTDGRYLPRFKTLVEKSTGGGDDMDL